MNNLENKIICVERCVQYTKIPQEKYEKLALHPDLNFLDEKESSKNGEFVKPDIKEPIENFGKVGKISFENYSVRYRPQAPLVLKNLNIEIKPSEKIGVVGRTGSGKSTLCLCLFRILEAENGKIYIDDQDISKIALEKLREILTIIPQDPTMIEGTLRENVDPSESFSDEEIKQILLKVGLDDFIEKSLDYQILEEGSNISVGEKQLICIARALIKKTKIILMDEATANVDYKTETLLQNCISTILKESTVITIAHRIKTVINYDKILVLDDGMIVDFDTPSNLIAKKGLFYQLYKESATS